MIETGVIRLRESDNKLAGTLIAPKHIDTRFLDPLGVHERDKLEQ